MKQNKRGRKDRTVKIPEKYHYRIRLRSVQNRVPMQSYLVRLLDYALENEDKIKIVA